MAKSPDAFRTISEVADWLGVEAHVLRFWETKFAQVKPVKRAGGRRYYRPSDMALLGGIRRLLHDDGMTIRGVQKILREKGASHVSGLAQELRSARVEPAAPARAPREVASADAAGPEVASTGTAERKAPVVNDRAPAVNDEAPTLPFDLPPAPAPEAPAAEAPAPASASDGSGQSRARETAAEEAPVNDGAPQPVGVRSRVAQLDQAAAAEVLARARALVERLRNTPE